MLFRRLANKLSKVSNDLEVRGHLTRAGLVNADRINTFTTKKELEALLTLALRVPKGTDVVEIGSYLGASTCYIAAGLVGKDCQLTCIDTWQNQTMPDGERNTMTEFEFNLKPVAGMLRTIKSRTDQITSNQLPTSIALAFLDGDHSYEATKLDFKLVEERIADSGVIAFHDALYFRGVSQVLGEALSSGNWILAGCCNNLSWLRKGPFSM